MTRFTQETLQKMADRLREHPRGEEDLDTAAAIEKLATVFFVAREVVVAGTHEQSMAAYRELIDLIKGKAVD
jgi:hypothetical protein